MCLKPPNPKNFSNLWIVLNMCKWDLGKVRGCLCVTSAARAVVRAHLALHTRAAGGNGRCSLVI
jgi:hypothetical protein